jgi:DNA methylase
MTDNLPAIRTIKNEADYFRALDEAQALVSQIQTVEQAADLAGRAAAAQAWATRAKLGQRNVNIAIGTKLWAERRGGELLAKMPKSEGGRPSKTPQQSGGVSTLDDLGVSYNESSEWQKLAAIPAPAFAKAIKDAAATGKLSAAAVLKTKGRSDRDKAKREQREHAEAEARDEIATLGEDAYRVDVANLTSWDPGEIGCIVTDPPYITDDAVELHSQLADFAVEHLPDHGALAVMTWQPLLQRVLEAMRRPELVYRWTAAWVFETPARTAERGPRVFDGWKPILVFHKAGWTDETTYLYDVIRSADADKASHEWGQNIDGFRQLVRAFSNAGETVCDPFVGGGTTAIAALAEHRKFVGCDVDEQAVATTLSRLA